MTPETATLPKISLHDHLDGGLRPGTLLELAAACGHTPPAQDADAVAEWFFEAASSGDLPRYLETFDHTIAVLQTADALRRVAREWVEDQAADGVIVAEARWAPEQHVAGGLSLADTIAAVGAGLAEGMDAVRASGGDIVARQLVTAMRHTDRSSEIADVFLALRDDPAMLIGGFDLAGAEAGFPPSKHAEAFGKLRAGLANITIHAGEAAGVESVQDALVHGAQRIGHGVRIVEDIDRSGGRVRLGRVARFVLDHQIPLEVCPSSNLQTGATSTDLAEHPVRLLDELGFNITINCDNRLQSRTTMTREFDLLVETFGYETSDLERFTTNAARAAFIDHEAAERLIAQVIEPAYAGVVAD